MNNVITEQCAYCDEEVEIPNNKESICPSCGSRILPCNMCDPNIVKCSECMYDK